MKENKIIWDYDNGNFEYYLKTHIDNTTEDVITVKVKDLLEILDMLDWELFDYYTFTLYKGFLEHNFSNEDIEFVRVINQYGYIMDFDTVKQAKDYINGLVANPKNNIGDYDFEIKVYLNNYNREVFE